MILHGKTAVVFAATGAVAGGVAHALAREGANVFLSGRDAARLDALAHAIDGGEGRIESDVVDATDAHAIEAYLQKVLGESGRLDVHFNGIGGRPEELGYPARSEEASLERFLIPLQRIVGSTFLTARSSARVMAGYGGGSVVTLSATLSGMTASYMASISATCGAVEALTRSLAGEYGPRGVRVNCVRGSAMPETRTIRETFGGIVAITGEGGAMGTPPLGRPITVDETAKAVAFLASDLASGMTGQTVTVCAGAFV